MRKNKNQQALSLIELTVGIAIILIIAGLSFGQIGQVLSRAESAQCIGNLRQIGVALNSYLAEHDMRMPDLALGRESTSEDIPVIDTILAPYVDSPRVFLCPSDRQGIGQASGTSYFWNSTLSGQPLAGLNFLNLTDIHSSIPVISDKEGFHKHQENRVNILYADGRATSGLQFSTSIP